MNKSGATSYKVGSDMFRNEERFNMDKFDEAASKYICIVKSLVCD